MYTFCISSLVPLRMYITHISAVCFSKHAVSMHEADNFLLRIECLWLNTLYRRVILHLVHILRFFSFKKRCFNHSASFICNREQCQAHMSGHHQKSLNQKSILNIFNKNTKIATKFMDRLNEALAIWNTDSLVTIFQTSARLSCPVHAGTILSWLMADCLHRPCI